MTFTYDLATDRGKVRLLIPDRIEDEALFDDDEIDAFLVLEESVREATALALETIASDQTLVLKVIKLGDLSTDGPKVSDALRARAADLRSQATDEEAEEDSGAFDVVEMVPNAFSWRERMYNEALRSNS
jgi:hypothetical protein